LRAGISQAFYLGICEALHTRLARIELVTWLHIRTMEASMHGTFDRSGESSNRTGRGWDIGFFAMPVLLVIVLIGLAVTHPSLSVWISDAVPSGKWLEFGLALSPGNKKVSFQAARSIG
jgi:hypothetical protein